MDKQLKKLSIEYVRIPAVYGKNLTEEEKKKHYDKKKNIQDDLNDGELGCALSHRTAQEKVYNEKISYGLVLEDDVTLPDNFKEIVEREIAKNTSGSKWDYLSFDYFAYGLDFFNLWLPGIKDIARQKKGILEKTFFIATSLMKGIYLLALLSLEQIQITVYKNCAISPIKTPSFAGAYILTNRGAKKLLSVSDKIVYIADRLPIVARKKVNLNFKIYTPLVVRQLKEVFDSNLHTTQ